MRNGHYIFHYIPYIIVYGTNDTFFSFFLRITRRALVQFLEFVFQSLYESQDHQLTTPFQFPNYLHTSKMCFHQYSFLGKPLLALLCRNSVICLR